MQENLARGLSLVSRAVSSRATLPVLANVLLKTQDGGLRLTATNLEIGISVWVPGKIETDGTMTVPARLITDVVGGLPAGERVDLEMEERRHAAHPGRQLQDPPARHRGRRVPGHPRCRRPAHHPGQPEGTPAGPLGGHLRGRRRRDTTDPDRRADAVLRRDADAGRRGQLPHRGQDPRAACSRSRRPAWSSRRARTPSSCASSATPTSRSTSSWPRPRARSSSRSTPPRS